MNLEIHTWDIAVFGLYFVVVLTIAIMAAYKKDERERTSEDFFLASRALPWWIIGTSLIASNISAEQMIGMTGSAYAGGLAVVSYEWMAAITLLIVAKWFLPIFLKMQIYSMPQYLEQRFDYRVSTGLAVFWLLVYIFVNLTSVMYLGALTMKSFIGLDVESMGMEPTDWNEWFLLFMPVCVLAVISMVYTIYGGLTSVAWTDFIQVAVLFIGGTAVSIFGLYAVSDGTGVIAGFFELMEEAPGHFHTVMAWDHNLYPWIGVFFGGMWAANLSYWGCNQYITQRALAAKNISEAQHGLVFAAFLKVIVPVVVLLPGIIAYALYADIIGDANDQAYATLLRELIPIGFRGLIFAAFIAAIVSSLNSIANSTATIFTMDIFKRFRPNTDEWGLVTIGRITTFVVLVIGALCAPMMRSVPEAFQYIQEYTGFISPGVVGIFLLGLFWKRCTAIAAVWMAIVTIPLSALLKFLPYLDPEAIWARFLDPFLNRMGVALIIVVIVGIIISLNTRHASDEEVEKIAEGATFKTTALYNVLAILICGILAALYLYFF